MADDLKPLPVKDEALEQIDNLGSDFNSTDFDDALKAQTAAAKKKALKEFPGDTAPVDEPVVASGNVDDDALVAAVTVEPTAQAPADSTAAASTDAIADAAAAKPATPAAEPKAAEPAAPAAEPVKPTYDPAEKFALAEGFDVTREQAMQALRERQAWGQAANAFQEVFRCTPEQAQQFWKPYVDRLVAEPKLGEWVDTAIATFDNPEKLAYIQKCAAFFDSESPAQPAARPQPAAIPPEVQSELQANREFRARIEAQQSQEYFNRELAAAREKYPQIADPTLDKILRDRTMLMLTHQEQSGQPRTYTFTQAVADYAQLIEKWAAPSQAAQPASAPAKVPALNTSSGASASVRQPVDMKPRKFDNPDAALADWEANMAGQLGFK